jgi:hypothetical protein
MIIPSYWYPCHNASDPPHGQMSCPWDQVLADSAGGNYSAIGAVILNPDSGPGASFNPAYAAQSAAVQAADGGMLVLGYVHTSYGNRSLASVLADVSAYAAWYGVDGIFVDEASSDCAQLAYYEQVYAFIKANVRGSGGESGGGRQGSDEGGSGAGTDGPVPPPPPRPLVVLNPGDASEACYLNASDVLVIFEGSFAAYNASSYAPPPWQAGVPPPRLAHIVYNASLDGNQHEAALALSKARGAGYVYVTPLGLPNPYAGLPSPYIYWDQELRWVLDII